MWPVDGLSMWPQIDLCTHVDFRGRIGFESILFEGRSMRQLRIAKRHLCTLIVTPRSAIEQGRGWIGSSDRFWKKRRDLIAIRSTARLVIEDAFDHPRLGRDLGRVQSIGKIDERSILEVIASRFIVKYRFSRDRFGTLSIGSTSLHKSNVSAR